MDLMGKHFFPLYLQLRLEQRWSCNVVHQPLFHWNICVAQQLVKVYQILKHCSLYPSLLESNDIFVMNLIGSWKSIYLHKGAVMLMYDIDSFKIFILQRIKFRAPSNGHSGFCQQVWPTRDNKSNWYKSSLQE